MGDRASVDTIGLLTNPNMHTCTSWLKPSATHPRATNPAERTAMPRKRRRKSQDPAGNHGGSRAKTAASTDDQATQAWGVMVGLGSIHYTEADVILHQGYLHPKTWHCLARHYQRLDHTPTMTEATIAQRLSRVATTTATRAVRIITGQEGSPAYGPTTFKPRSILEYLVAAPLSDTQLADVRAQVVRDEGCITLLP